MQKFMIDEQLRIGTPSQVKVRLAHQLVQLLPRRNQFIRGKSLLPVQMRPQVQGAVGEADAALAAVVVVEPAALHEELEGIVDTFPAGNGEWRLPQTDTAGLPHVRRRQMKQRRLRRLGLLLDGKNGVLLTLSQENHPRHGQTIVPVVGDGLPQPRRDVDGNEFFTALLLPEQRVMGQQSG